MSAFTGQMLRNLLTGWLAITIRAGLALVLVPFLLRQLGVESFGLIGLLGVIMSLALMTDLGLRAALGRELAECRVRGDTEGLNRLASSALAVYLALALALAAFFIAAAPWLVDTVRVSAELRDTAIRLLRFYGTGSTLIAFVTPVYSAALDSLQRFDIQHTVRTAAQLVGGVLLLLVLPWTRHDLYAWAAVMLGADLASLAAMAVRTHRLCPEFRLSPGRARPAHVRPLLKLGGYMYAVQMTQSLAERVDPLILSRFFGPGGVALYTPGGRISQLLQPLVSLFAEPFCRLWLGAGLGPAYRTAAWIMIGWAAVDFLSYTGGTTWAILLGMEKLGFITAMQLVSAIFNVLISIALVGYTPLGIPGVMVATVAIGLIRRPIIVAAICRWMALPVRDYLAASFAAPLAVTAVTALVMLALREGLRVGSYPLLLLALFVSGLVWAGLSWCFGLAPSDRERVARLLASYRHRSRARP